jgi:hypothetical protein
MSSPTPLPLLDFERAVGGAIAYAVSTVAERSFFACVERCDKPDLDEIEADWLVATVRFDDGPVCGSLACALPADLALRLFDAFAGRHPAAPLPPRDHVDDLIGEFANMVCGAWLTRCDTRRVYVLRRPLVSRGSRPDRDQGRREWLAVNNRPVAVDWDLAPASADAATERGR